ncbi:multiple C2 and transmembrane domain-containing protein 1-like [Paramacrobiotus metropolitanus]|uniref:multiple C2 and transmembrane domain-containing protein 1-like n=1 Tax=Paramacrobiotus metropolitanus TaxID=2943436 RepID=UPI002445BB1B|nr:multiple C2 and transmembrane domain-containing protein 1-like [Paramacrobiotus metropolitanus]XP_055327263.1 multiple C2 and transmembrane domain-containing protein 1-like [Paramacrobiotus metropolitanus]XP_055327265.1 multiple C2 and transmembrane domain-containing protein 1-like [Paramacrobiotus metropolitanus]XP_055327266.1 multiple C2 and transmembrane domain-containing protein 1-like [Paramacrobiotus metropolitanus]XP_055327267.1 multiple C2 and transmembrane domain-containing protein 
MSTSDSVFPSSSQIPSDHRTQVTVFLYEAKDLPPMDRNGLSDPFCKFQIGNSKFRSRIIRKTLNPQWMEEFNFYLQKSDSRVLNVSVWDWDRALKNEVMGRGQVDLAVLSYGIRHDLWVNIIEKGSHRGSVHLSILLQDSSNKKQRKISKENGDVVMKNDAEVVDDLHEWDNLSLNSDDVPEPTTPTIRKPLGLLTVYLQKLSELIAVQDAGGSVAKNVYCILQLGRVKYQTHNVSRNTSPEWNSEYEFPVYDVHAALEIVVMEKDAKGRKNILGCLAVPLLNVHSGVRKGYRLKDARLMRFLQPTVWLQMNLAYDLTLAAWRTLQPQEVVGSELDKKPGSQMLVHKVNQIRRVVSICSDALDLLRALLSWEIPTYSIIAYVLYIFIVYFFQLYWIPVFLLASFLKGYIDRLSNQNSDAPETEYEAQFDNASGEASVVSSASTSGSRTTETWNPLTRFRATSELLQMLPENLSSRTFWRKVFSRETGSNLVNNARTAHDQARFVQHVLEFLADVYERLCNTFNFTVPWLSFMAVYMLCGAMVLFYVCSFRTILLMWGTYEFSKGYFGYNNFELLAFLSRVHTKHERKMYKEMV